MQSLVILLLLAAVCLCTDINVHIHDYTCTFNGITYEDGQVIPIPRLLITRDPCWTCWCRGGVLTVCTDETCPRVVGNEGNQE